MAPMMMMKAEMSMDAAVGAAPMPMGRAFAANGGGGGGGGGMPPPPEIRIRKAFPETWIFTELNEHDDKTELVQMVPDTITSWIINAFQIISSDGLGVTKSSSKLTVFRPFFIVLSVPYSVIQGEVFTLKVLVHNYLGHPVGARVTLENPDDAFTLAIGEEGILTKTIDSIPSPSVAVVTFVISPTKIGDLVLSLKAVASTNEAGDGVTQPLIVKPPGVKQSKTDAVFVNLLKSSNKIVRKTLSATFPEHRVPGGDIVKFTVIGDIIGGAIINLESLIQLPSGCGEQNMINFVPDLVVLDYLKSIGSLTTFVKTKAVSYLEVGYQRELTFKRFDSSFSAFGNTDADGSTWLTAFVVRSFIGAKRYISIDDAVLISSLDFLIRQQSDNGSFVENGYIHDLVLQGGGGGSTYALTAFTLLTFVEAKSLPSLQDKENPRNYGGIVKPASVEMTAYALLTYLIREGDELKDSIEIGHWLLKQRNDQGGFISTQDTVVGLTALAGLAKATSTPNYNVKVKLLLPAGVTRTIDIGADDVGTLQEYFLPAGLTSVTFEAEGVGTALAQLSWIYYTMKTGNNSAFSLEIDVQPKDKNRLLHFVICTAYKQGDKSNMAILEVNIPTGYGFEQDELIDLKKDVAIKRTELENSDSKLNIYFNSLTAKTTCVTVTAHRIHFVAKHSKSSVSVYDYYDTTQRVTKLYDGAEVDPCQICELDDSCKAHKCV
ncbi:CD109 antigen-like [Folsomia candida]|uniref:CD109 antigen-like n=1 Tax=Folsomia candida TaxID=158441 RepID=UPI0016053F9D|nr:CD109 antigen-like [Folsomia candida]